MDWKHNFVYFLLKSFIYEGRGSILFSHVSHTVLTAVYSSERLQFSSVQALKEQRQAQQRELTVAA